MRRSVTHLVTLCLFYACITDAGAAQSVSPDLAQVSGRVVQHFREKHPGWKHETAQPPTPPGGAPSRDVAIHFWSSENCLTAELRLDGTSYGSKPVPCRFKLAIDQSASSVDARERLVGFVNNQRGDGFEPIQVGDKGYVWNGSRVVFVKGSFTFWLDGGADLHVGDFSVNREFIERTAKEVSDAIN
ncbi:MAG: hypothetical protein LC746_14745 [Acidobacteria bacterium]|nr:hypothetical protein [Acidobacteriota bacterium]